MGMCSTPEGRKKTKGKCPPMEVAKEFRTRRGKMLHDKMRGG